MDLRRPLALGVFKKVSKRKLLSYKDTIVDQAKPIVPYLRKKRILVLSGWTLLLQP